tara:strand:- start:1416 stop:1709 length:294 start_codon:yes stop_codon:yes gene_type:complete
MDKPTLLDAMFVALVTYLGAKMVFKMVGLPVKYGGIMAIGAVAVSSYHLGPPELQKVAGYVMLPGNTLRNALDSIPFAPKPDAIDTTASEVNDGSAT